MLIRCVLFFSVVACRLAWGATLTAVPMQGGMVMPMISYDADLDSLGVMMPVEVPELTPLLVSHPGDSFDPVNPWFIDLDPSAQGLSFSRRYGFVMSGMSDPVPPEREIWLRKISGPEELKFYRYAATPAPGAWEPIFGTGGSPAARFWNLRMFHPGVTAPPGTNGFTAVFEAYLVDTATEQELPGTAVTMTLDFTNLPDGRPELSLGMMFAVGWDVATTNVVLETTVDLTSGSWVQATQTVVVVEDQNMVLIPADSVGNLHFRLRLDE